MAAQHGGQGGEGAGVGQARVGARVVGHEEEEQREDQVLQREREEVDVAPRRELSDDAGQDAREQDAEEIAGHDDGEGRGATVRRR